MRKLPKSSPWPFFAPASFRHRIQKHMTPLPFDLAEKKKFKVSLGYVLVSVIGLHYVLYDKFFKTKDDSVEDNLSDGNKLILYLFSYHTNRILRRYFQIFVEISTMMTIANVKNPQGHVYSFSNLKLNTVEHFDKEEWLKKRHSASSDSQE